MLGIKQYCIITPGIAVHLCKTHSEPMGEGRGLEMHSVFGLEESKYLDGEQPMQPHFEDL